MRRTWKDMSKLALSVRIEALSRWVSAEKSLPQGVRRGIQSAIGKHAR